MKIYLVGGAVRDQLLGLPVKERDYVVVGTTPEQMLAQGFRLVGKDFPVFLHPKTHEEYALARTERKTGYGYKGFSCYAAPDVTLEADLQRRDLTINAMAQTSEGMIIDPYHGQNDIIARRLRHVSPAFSEDPVRVLRVARFMARFAPLGFQVSSDTMMLMKKMVEAGEVNVLVPERVWQEFSSALTESAPQAFIKTLYDCGALAVLFPLLQDLILNQKLGEICDTQLSCLATLERATRLTNDPIVRFAAIFCGLRQDLSFNSQQVNEKGGLQVQELCQHYHVPRAYSSLALLTVRYLLCCHRVFELDADALLNLLERTGAFQFLQRFHQFLLVCEADFLAHSKRQTDRYLQKERILSALTIAKAVPAAPLKKLGLSGMILGKKLREQRVQAISRFIDFD